MDELRKKYLSLLIQVRNHLWKQPTHGKAAVMVGSGFSRNSEPQIPNPPKFPTWTDLANELWRDIDDKTEPKPGLTPIRIAGLVEARFGRRHLNMRVCSIVPDKQYSPSELHKKLLDLPWSDVFTTNYDTLLERTQPQLSPHRSYSVVCTISDICTATQPRIVKLHGSFPNHEPFTVTEEDYRGYPARCAPFVNLVQQSMMENAFVLIGFSGDDPNFHLWTGWVRDNLHENAPKIYLCVIENTLSEPEITLLERKNVSVIDINAAFDLQHASPADAHDALFQFLATNPHPDPRDWLADYSGSTVVGHTPEARLASLSKFKTAYPGWIICPEFIRRRVWDNIVVPECQWLSGNEKFHECPITHRIEYLATLIWYLELCHLPLLEPVFSVSTSCISERFAPNTVGIDHLPAANDAHRNSFASVLLSLMRYCSHKVDSDNFDIFHGFFDQLSVRDNELLIRQHYESCLNAWWQLDYPRLATLLADWPDLPGIPFWNARRASLLVNIGQPQLAHSLADAALTEIREQVKNDPENVTVLSQEAWLMSLVSRLSFHTERANTTNNKELRGRWRKLAAFECDPQNEIASFIEILPQKTAHTTMKDDFDLGRVTISHWSGSTREALNDLTPLAASYFSENAAIQIRLGTVTNFSERIRDFVSRTVEEGVKGAISLAIRSENKEALEVLDRTVMTLSGRDYCEDVCDWLSEVAESLISVHPEHSATQGSFALRNGIRAGVLEMLSRTTVCLGEERLERLFDLTCRLYSSPTIKSNYVYSEKLGVLFFRIFRAADEHQSTKLAIATLELPLGRGDTLTTDTDDMWPEPLHPAPVRDESVQNLNPEQVRTIRIHTRQLLDKLNQFETSFEPTWRAFARLYFLLRSGLLTTGESIEFSRAMRKMLSDGNVSISNLWGKYRPIALASLPAINGVSPLLVIKDWLWGSSFMQRSISLPRTRHRSVPGPLELESGIIVRTLIDLTAIKWRKASKLENKTRLAWDPHEAKQIVDACVLCWNENHDLLVSEANLKRGFFHIDDDTPIFFERVACLMTKSLIPYLFASSSEFDRHWKVLQEMLLRNIAIQKHMHMLLLLNKNFVSEIEECVVDGISSSLMSVKTSSMRCVLDWLRMCTLRGCGNVRPTDRVKSRLLSEAISAIGEEADSAYRICAAIIEEFPNFFTLSDLEMLAWSLKKQQGASVLEIWNLSRSGQLQSAAADLFPFKVVYSANILASALAQQFAQRKASQPEVLASWNKLIAELGSRDFTIRWEEIK